MITATGIGSGLDVEGLVSQLLAVEAQPVNARLDRREGKLQAELSAIGTLRSALSTFSTSAVRLSTCSCVPSTAAIILFRVRGRAGRPAGSRRRAVMDLA